jgi:hypothetical protein
MVGGLLAQPGPHALYHAGHLYLLRSHWQALQPHRRATRQRARDQAMNPAWRRLGMNISAPFIRRPVATTLLTVAIALAGAIAYHRAARLAAAAGGLSPPSRSAHRCPGASAGHRRLLHRHSAGAPVRHIAGVTEMTSSSSLGSTSVTLQFDLSRNIDGAARDVEAAINAAHLSSRQPARQPDLSQSEPGRFAHHDHWPYLQYLRAPSSTTYASTVVRKSSRRSTASAR